MSRTRSISLLLAAAALTFGACASGEPEAIEIDPTPVSVDEPASEREITEARVPYHLWGMVAVDPGWDTLPQHADGVFLAPGEDEDGQALTFTAVDEEGTILWTAQRPLSCSGFTLTTDADGRALAVLTDVATTDDALAGTTATAYDLHTGEEVWGPVTVPGPHYGPGVVFAEPPPEAMGATGPRVALDPATGEVIAEETGTQDRGIVGEYHGILLLAEQNDLVAQEAATGEETWRHALADFGWEADQVRSAPEHRHTAGRPALVGDPETGYALIDPHTGTVLATEADQADTEPLSGTHIIRRDQELHGYTPEGEALWTSVAEGDLTLTAAGGGFAYTLHGDAVQVHNAVTGEIAQAYDPEATGPIAVPEAMTATGAAIIRL